MAMDHRCKVAFFTMLMVAVFMLTMMTVYRFEISMYYVTHVLLPQLFTGFPSDSAFNFQ